MEDFHNQKWGRTMELLGKERKNCFRQLYLPLEGRVRGLTMQIASLMLIKNPQTDRFKIPVLWAAQTVLRLANKSWWGLAKYIYEWYMGDIVLSEAIVDKAMVYCSMAMPEVPYCPASVLNWAVILDT